MNGSLRFRLNSEGEREVVPTPFSVLLALIAIFLFVWGMASLVNIND
jgi:hypothetical protein